MRVCVTGGAGFIGSNLVDALFERGHDVGVIDDLSAGKLQNVPSAAWLAVLDILDPEMPAALAEFAPDVIVHLAAQASVSASIRDPERDFAVNAIGTVAVARAARDLGVRRMISASSAAVYGEPDEALLPLSETAPKAPANPYGVSKLAAEGRLADELLGGATDFASFRFSNVYGPRQDAAGEGGVVSLFCARMHEGATPVIYGTGDQTRDFIFVGDIVRAIVAALEADSPLALDSGDAAAFNISTTAETSVNDLLGALRRASGYAGPVDQEPAREGDVDRSSLSAEKAERVFGWRAATPLGDGLAETWRWYASQA